jgi:hypothetical protein
LFHLTRTGTGLLRVTDRGRSMRYLLLVLLFCSSAFLPFCKNSLSAYNIIIDILSILSFYHIIIIPMWALSDASPILSRYCTISFSNIIKIIYNDHSCSTGKNNRMPKNCLPHREEACGNQADTEETKYVLEVSGAGQASPTSDWVPSSHILRWVSWCAHTTKLNRTHLPYTSTQLNSLV